MSGLRKPLLLLLAGTALGGGLWSGLVRLGALSSGADLASVHGPLMVSGFLGTVICLERAVAVDRAWAYAVPALSALGALCLVAGLPWTLAAVLGVLAAAGLAGLFGYLARRDPTVHVVVMGAGAVALLAGDLAWLFGAPMVIVAWWWVGFLVLTIVGERLELNRVRRLPRVSTAALVLAVALLGVALPVTQVVPEVGVRLVGLALAACATWLLVFDVARRTVRGSGVARFSAVCLLAGYVWLGVAGVLAGVLGVQWAGAFYDAQLHAVFVGFVFSMILGHAPIVLPAVLGRPLPYRPVAYLPLVLLHASLVARVLGDVGGLAALRTWGGVGNVAALVGFVAVTITGAALARRSLAVETA